MDAAMSLVLSMPLSMPLGLSMLLGLSMPAVEDDDGAHADAVAGAIGDASCTDAVAGATGDASCTDASSHLSRSLVLASTISGSVRKVMV